MKDDLEWCKCPLGEYEDDYKVTGTRMSGAASQKTKPDDVAVSFKALLNTDAPEGFEAAKKNGGAATVRRIRFTFCLEAPSGTSRRCKARSADTIIQEVGIA